MCVLAYNWQRIFYIECIDGMISDVPNHVKLAMGHNDYGLSSYLIRFLYGAFGEHRGQTLLSLCLAANNVVGLFTVWLLVRRLLPELEGSFAFLAAVLAALGEREEGDEFAGMARLAALTGQTPPPALAALREKRVLHRDVIDREEIVDYVARWLREEGAPC